MNYPEYTGYSYEQASRKALELVESAAKTGQTLGDLPYRLRVLKDIADREKNAHPSS